MSGEKISYREPDALIQVENALGWDAARLIPVIATDKECLQTLQELELLHGVLVAEEPSTSATATPVGDATANPLGLASFCAAAAIFVILALLPGSATGVTSVALAAAVSAIVGPASALTARKAGWL